VLAVRWYLRFPLSYRDVEELLTERGIQVDHVTIYRWVLRFTPLLAEAARPCRHAVGDRWWVDETYVRFAREGRRPMALCVPRDRPVRPGHRRDRLSTARRQGGPPVLWSGPSARPGADPSRWSPIKRRPTRSYPVELLPAAWHRTDRYTNNRVEADHGRLKARLGPMRGLKQDCSARIVIAGHASVQNLRRGWYELAVEEPTNRRVAAAFHELALAI
jgi:transposase-like protein